MINCLILIFKNLPPAAKIAIQDNSSVTSEPTTNKIASKNIDSDQIQSAIKEYLEFDLLTNSEFKKKPWNWNCHSTI